MNLLSGCVGIVLVSQGYISWAAACMFLGAVFDFFDGFAARIFKANSPIGLQLDSLADMVTFGVLPAMMVFYALPDAPFGSVLQTIITYSPFIIAIFSALRLAKFNIDTRQSDSFIGLPTPANAIFIASALTYIEMNNISTSGYWYVYILVSIVLSLLLVSEIPMFSLKVKKHEGDPPFLKKYAVQLLFLAASLLFIIFFRVGGLALSILLYIGISVVSWLFCKKAKG